MSGKDERPDFMPVCNNCEVSSGWLIVEGLPGYTRQVMCVNFHETAIHMYGKWNTHSASKTSIIERATSMKCGTCNKRASVEDFENLMALFQREVIYND